MKETMNKENFWVEKLKNADELNLPAFVNDSNLAVISFDVLISSEDLTQIKKIGNNKDFNVLKLFVSALGILMWKFYSATDIILGIPPLKLPNSDISKSGTIYTRFKLNKSTIVNSLLNAVHESLNDGYLNSEYDELLFERLYNIRTGGNLNRIKKIGFSYDKINATGNWLNVHHLAFELFERDQSFIRVSTREALFPKEMFQTMVDSLVCLVLGLPGNKNNSVSCCSAVSVNRLDLFQKQFSKNVRVYPTDITVIDLFTEVSKKLPGSIAVVCGSEKLTYSELDLRSMHIAHYLIKNTKKRTPPFAGVMMDRSIDSIIVVVGILRAGFAYVPLDKDYPKERVKEIIDDTGCTIVFSDFDDQPHNKVGECEFVNIAGVSLGEQLVAINNPKPVDVAYVIYSSGTTGKPKGIMIQHSAILNLLYWYNEKYEINSQTRIVQLTNLVVDIAFQEIFSSLINGLTLFIPENNERHDKSLFIDFLDRNRINFIQVIPDMLKEYFLDIPKIKSLDHILCGGDRLSEKLKDAILSKGYRLHNIYGQTETTIDTVGSDCVYGETIKFNEFVPNYDVWILDEGRNICPDYITGEIYTGGIGLAQGYLNNPQMTNEFFCSHPFKENQKIYKTGDFGKRFPDGSIQLVGRMDQQVKIRGYRIELVEIERAIISNKAVEDAVVMCTEDKTGDKILTAYIVEKKNDFIHQTTGEKYSVKCFDGSAEMYRQMELMHASARPAFFKRSEIAPTYWSKIYLAFPDCQMGVYNYQNELIGTINSVPIVWNGEKNSLPGGWDEAVIKAFEHRSDSIICNTLCALNPLINKSYDGKGWSHEVLKSMSIFAKSKMFQHFIVPVRPTHKHDFLSLSLEQYCKKTIPGGELFDDWLRIHIRLGAKILNYSNRSQLITGTAEEWKNYAGLEFKESKSYIVAGVMQEVVFDIDKNEGVCYDQAVWVEHNLDFLNSDKIENLNILELRDQLFKQLPSYMAPSNYVRIDSLPLTTTGKIDRASLLLEKNSILTLKVEPLAPRNEVEKTLLNIWTSILGKDDIGINDNFFDLGGNSIKAIKMIFALNKTFNVNINIQHFFQYPTLEEMAKYVLLNQTIDENGFATKIEI